MALSPGLNREKSTIGRTDLVNNVQHTTHVTFDPATGKFVGLPKEWEKAVMSSFGLPVALYVSEVVPGYTAKIPRVLVMMRQYLHDKNAFKQHGIFRVAPDQKERDIVLQQLAQGTFTGCRDVHCVSYAIKVWFRELPSPLFKWIDIEALKNCNSDEQATALLEAQSEPAKSLAFWLMDVCCDVIEFAKVNAMSAKNMSIVMSPNLIRLEDRDREEPLEVFNISKRFTDFFERCLNMRMKQRGKFPSRKISVRPVARQSTHMSVDPLSRIIEEEVLPPPPREESSDDELPPEHPPPEPSSDDEEPNSPPSQTGFVLPLVNPREMLSFQLADFFPVWREVLELKPPKGSCSECDQEGIIFCAACNTLLCDSHDSAIHSFRARATHARCIASEAMGSPPNCDSHSQPLKLFCLTCGRPVCRDCKDGSHQEHMIVLIVFTPSKKIASLSPLNNEQKTSFNKPAPLAAAPVRAEATTEQKIEQASDSLVATEQKEQTSDPSPSRNIETSDVTQEGKHLSPDESLSKANESSKRPAPKKPAPGRPANSPVYPRGEASSSAVHATDGALPAVKSATSSFFAALLASSNTPFQASSPVSTTETTASTSGLSEVPSASALTVSSSTPTTASSVVALPSSLSEAFATGQSVRALFDFSRSQKGYVTMTAREILTVVKSSPQLSATGWVLVKNVAGMQGYVPFNYIKAL